MNKKITAEERGLRQWPSQFIEESQDVNSDEILEPERLHDKDIEKGKLNSGEMAPRSEQVSNVRGQKKVHSQSADSGSSTPISKGSPAVGETEEHTHHGNTLYEGGEEKDSYDERMHGDNDITGYAQAKYSIRKASNSRISQFKQWNDFFAIRLASATSTVKELEYLERTKIDLLSEGIDLFSRTATYNPYGREWADEEGRIYDEAKEERLREVNIGQPPYTEQNLESERDPDQYYPEDNVGDFTYEGASVREEWTRPESEKARGNSISDYMEKARDIWACLEVKNPFLRQSQNQFSNSFYRNDPQDSVSVSPQGLKLPIPQSAGEQPQEEKDLIDQEAESLETFPQGPPNMRPIIRKK